MLAPDSKAFDIRPDIGRLQQIEVRGTVTDSSGATLPGVSVIVKGQSSIGTTTDLNGKYMLDLPNDGLTLVYSLIGFETQELQVKGKEVIDVELSISSSQLDDVVVVALGKQKKDRKSVGRERVVRYG